MTTFDVIFADLDDCDRATLHGAITRALAADERITEMLRFRGHVHFEVHDTDPETPRDGFEPSRLAVRVGEPDSMTRL